MNIFVGIVVLVGVILAIALPIASFKSLEPSEIGLRYSAWRKKINEDILYSQGRHSVGLHNYFIKYPIEYQNFQFNNISARTKDGLNVYFDVSFQYRMNQELDAIVKLFYQFPFDTYIGAYEDQSYNAIRNTAADWTAFEYVTNRSDIEEELRSNTRLALESYGASVENFQVLQIRYPEKFQDSIESAQTAQLEIETVSNNKLKITQEEEGRVRKATTEASILINQASIKATNIQALANQKIQYNRNRLNSVKLSMAQMKTQLGLTNQEIIDYTKQNSIIDLSRSVGANRTLQLQATNPNDLYLRFNLFT